MLTMRSQRLGHADLQHLIDMARGANPSAPITLALDSRQAAGLASTTSHRCTRVPATKASWDDRRESASNELMCWAEDSTQAGGHARAPHPANQDELEVPAAACAVGADACIANGPEADHEPLDVRSGTYRQLRSGRIPNTPPDV
jgi:hypothetical protein